MIYTEIIEENTCTKEAKTKEETLNYNNEKAVF